MLVKGESYKLMYNARTNIRNSLRLRKFASSDLKQLHWRYTPVTPAILRYSSDKVVIRNFAELNLKINRSKDLNCAILSQRLVSQLLIPCSLLCITKNSSLYICTLRSNICRCVALSSYQRIVCTKM